MYYKGILLSNVYDLMETKTWVLNIPMNIKNTITYMYNASYKVEIQFIR